MSVGLTDGESPIATTHNDLPEPTSRVDFLASDSELRTLERPVYHYCSRPNARSRCNVATT